MLETQPVIPAARNFGDWGTPRASALSIVVELLNGQLPKVMDELDDGRRVVNQQETLAAQEKAESLQRRFVEWLWSDADRAERLAHFYNDTFNAVRPREYDGSHLTLPGSNPAFTLRPHQKAAVWRTLQEPAVGLFHEVGAGKTTVMAAAAMELRRLGLASKILIVVPNDILQQFAEEFQHFYPLASLLVPGKDDFTPARRNEFMARIATGDWDAVIVAQSQFTLLPVHPRTEAEFIQRELAGYRDGLSEMADEARAGGDRSWRSSEKSIQKAIQRLSARLLGCQRRLEDRKRLTQTMTFEDLGVDRTFVDFTSRPFCVLHVGSDPQRVMWRALGGRPYAQGWLGLFVSATLLSGPKNIKWTVNFRAGVERYKWKSVNDIDGHIKTRNMAT